MIKYKIQLPNYDDCLVNLSSSILNRFGVIDNHKTMNDVDKIIKNYKKIVYIFFDGMGSYIMDYNLEKNSFLQTHKVRDFSSVFPPTTAAATTSFLACKNPNETGWLGWHLFIKDLNKDLVLFTNSGYYDENINEPNYSWNNLSYIDILTKIKDNGYRTKRINSFDGYQNFNDFENEILKFLKDDESGFCYAYNTEPDHLMHLNGVNSDIVKNTIHEINDLVIDLYNKIDNDTLLIISADHGHVDSNFINLYLDKEIIDNLKVKPFCDSRCIMFDVKDKDLFNKTFRHKYGGAFDLYTKEEVIKMKLFGDKENSENFLKNIGDFIAIAKSNYYIDYREDNETIFKSCHSGYTAEEMTIPLILIHK